MYVISYDIESDRTRTKIAKLLEDYGKRVQYSVFECKLTQKRYEKLYAELAKLLSSETNGNIRFYQLCRNCESRIATLGVSNKDDLFDDEDIFII